MNRRKVYRASKAFDALEKAQKEFDEAFNEMSEEEEAVFERELFKQGVTIHKINQSEKVKV